ncbi:MAG: NAD(P)/FAD-dependent oxidoreductase [Candidatus Heimdallarchaeota archaeon]
MSEINSFKVIIVGAGPAGLTSAIYTARAGISTLVFGSPYESQVAKLDIIENYPGFSKGVHGMELMESMEKQAQANGAKVNYASVISIEKDNGKFIVKSDEDESFIAESVILAMGARHRKMRIPGEEEYFMKGVSYCAVCDGALYQNKATAVLGYGDGAAKAALYLSNISSKVYLICPKEELGAEAIYMHRIKSKEIIEIHYKAKVSQISGSEYAEGLTFKQKGEPTDIKAEGIFIEAGSVPNTVLAEQIGVEINERSYIVSSVETMETNIPGVYAIGDVCGRVKQIATAVGDGCIAAYQAQNYLEEK